MTFENAFLVSEVSFKYDRFKIRISKAYLFRSKKFYKTISSDCEKKNCFIDYELGIPPQISDIQTGKAIVEGVSTIAVIMRGMQVNGLVQSFVMSYALESLWG